MWTTSQDRKCLDNSEEEGLPKVGHQGNFLWGNVFGWVLKDFRWYRRAEGISVRGKVL